MIRSRLQNWLSGMAPAHVLRAILVLAFAHGLAYVFLIPPWQHNDEPGHFEYVYLAAHAPHWPGAGDSDPAVRERIVDSLQATGWYKKFRSPNPADLVPIMVSEIGIPQLGDLPGYYLSASLVLRLVPQDTDMLAQMYIVRLFSLAMAVLTIFLVWKAMEELLPEDHALRWMVPAFLALLPGYADMMTAVSNDVGGVAAGTLFLWLGLRLLGRPDFLKTFAAWTVSAVLCFYMNQPSRLLLLVAPLLIVLRLLSLRTLKVASWGAGIIVVAGLFLALRGNEAVGWFQSPPGDLPDRARPARTAFGAHALRLDDSSSRNLSSTGQLLGQPGLESLRGKSFTLGAWVWSDRPIRVGMPTLRFLIDFASSYFPTPQVTLGTEPAFYSYTGTIPAEAQRAILILPGPAPSRAVFTVFYDGFVLVEGEHSGSTPQFSDESLSRGIWNGEQFINLIRNPSIELGGVTVRPEIDKATARVPALAGHASLIVDALQDWPGAGWYFRAAAARLFQTFWARVAGANGPLPGAYDYDLLQLWSAVSAVGLAGFAWRCRSRLPFKQAIFLAIGLIVIWGIAFLRGAPELLNNYTVLPYARYAGPVIVASAFALCLGWHEAASRFARKFGSGTRFPALVFWAATGGISLYALSSFLTRYRESTVSAERLILFGLLVVTTFQIARACAGLLPAGPVDE